MLLALVTVLAAAPVKLALPEVNSVNLDPKVASFLGEHFAQQLKGHGLEVATQREIAALLGLERQKELLGCGASSCVAELANALGAEGVILMDLARLGERIRINVKVINAGSGKTLSTCSEQAPSEDAAAEALTRCANQVAGDFAGAPPPSRVLRPVVLVPAVLGAAAGITGAIFYSMGSGAFQELNRRDRTTPLSESAGLALRDDGKRNESLAVGLWVGGGALLVASAAIALLASPSPVVTPSVAPVAGGAVFGVGGSLP